MAKLVGKFFAGTADLHWMKMYFSHLLGFTPRAGIRSPGIEKSLGLSDPSLESRLEVTTLGSDDSGRRVLDCSELYLAYLGADSFAGVLVSLFPSRPILIRT